MKLRNPLERSPAPQPTQEQLLDLAREYLTYQHRLEEVFRDVMQDRGCDKNGARYFQDCANKLNELRAKGVTDSHLRMIEEDSINYHEADLNRYEESVQKDEAELAELEGKESPTGDDLAQMKRLRDRLYGLGGTNEARRGTHGTRIWVDRYASEQRERFAEDRKSLETKYPSSQQV